MYGECSAHKEDKNAYKILVGNPEGNTSVVDGRILLKWIIRK
jgi:hypothetical protein